MRKGLNIISRVKECILCILPQHPPSLLPISVLLAFILLVLWRVNEPPKFHIDMDLYSQDQGNL